MEIALSLLREGRRKRLEDGGDHLSVFVVLNMLVRVWVGSVLPSGERIRSSSKSNGKRSGLLRTHVISFFFTHVLTMQTAAKTAPTPVIATRGTTW